MPTDSGPLDILGVDAEGVMTIIELKVNEDDSQIIQGLRYSDFVSSNIIALAKVCAGAVNERMVYNAIGELSLGQMMDEKDMGTPEY